MAGHRIFTTPFASVYPHYIHKAERKGRTKEEVDEIICWLTGYDRAGLAEVLEQQVDFDTFFAQAPAMNPNCHLITGVVCGLISDVINAASALLDGVIDATRIGSAIQARKN